ncbi:MAG: COX15/CtaA family protein [Verrucomicrobiaceae bacterium]|nr:COX15/CtaA family protein [Verrucomicrobiaceae bacterium]
MQRAFHRYSLLTLAVGIALIWWGAAVTTEDVGLSVPDWPLCYGKINPEGWYKVPALLLEHGHRWLGMTIGWLVLGMYFWQFARFRPGLVEGVGIVLCSLGFLVLIHMGSLIMASVVAVLGFSWLVLKWYSQRWPLLRGFTTLALLLVVLQAALGGLRVLKMSDPLGITHGTLAQVFYCLLVFIAFASSRTWTEGRLVLSVKEAAKARFWSLALFLCVFGQLVLGASLRHTQRDHLAAGDILTTKGQWLPPATPSDVFLLFAHKYWGFIVAVLILFVAVRARSWLVTLPKVRVTALLLMVMPTIQVALGIFVILTGKGFWVTNFHVLNGLALLALSSLLVATFWGDALCRAEDEETA